MFQSWTQMLIASAIVGTSIVQPSLESLTLTIFLSPLFFIAPLSASRVSRPVGFEGDKSTPPDDVIIPHGSHNCKLFLHFLLRHFQQIGKLNFFIFCAIFLLIFCGVVCYNISPPRRGRRFRVFGIKVSKSKINSEHERGTCGRAIAL